jgi:hypothetical protein
MGANQTVLLIPDRPINNRRQVNNLPHLAAEPRCATTLRALENTVCQTPAQ